MAGAGAGGGPSGSRDKNLLEMSKEDPSSASASLALASVTPNIAHITEKRKEILRPKFKNTLPDPPCDVKMLPCDFNPDRFLTPLVHLNPEFYDQMVDWDVGVEVDLMDPWSFPSDIDDRSPQLEPGDEILLVDHIDEIKEGRRSMAHKQRVAWLRRPEYISTEQARFQPQAIEKVEAKVGYAIRKAMKEGAWDQQDHFTDSKSRVLAIEKTFEDAKVPIDKHHSKPDVYPVEVLEVFPDFELWKHSFAQIVFDVDPAPSCSDETKSAAVIRGFTTEDGEEIAGYFLPVQSSEKVLKKKAGNKTSSDNINLNEKDVAAKPSGDGAEDSVPENVDDKCKIYEMHREFAWKLKQYKPSDLHENFFFVERDNGMFYYGLPMRAGLNRVRSSASEKTMLYVKKGDFTAEDYACQLEREKMLQHPVLGDIEDEIPNVHQGSSEHGNCSETSESAAANNNPNQIVSDPETDDKQNEDVIIKTELDQRQRPPGNNCLSPDICPSSSPPSSSSSSSSSSECTESEPDD